jgi:hypothetical protein
MIGLAKLLSGLIGLVGTLFNAIKTALIYRAGQKSVIEKQEKEALQNVGEAQKVLAEKLDDVAGGDVNAGLSVRNSATQIGSIKSNKTGS